MKNVIRALLISFVLSAAGIGVLFLTGKGFSLSDFARFLTIKPEYVLYLALALVAWWLLSGWRLMILAQSEGVTLLRATRAFLLSLFAASVTPSATGSTFGMAWYLSKYTTAERATAVAVFSVGLDLVYFAWSLPVSILILHLRGIDIGVGIPLLVLTTGFTLTLAWILMFRSDLLRHFVNFVFQLRFLQRFRAGAQAFVEETIRSVALIRALPVPTQLLLHLITGCMYLTHFLAANALAAGIGLPIDHVALVATQSIIIAVGFLVPTPGGAGYFEVALGRAFAATNVPESAIGPFVIMWRVLSYYLYLLIGPFIGGSALIRDQQRQQERKAQDETALARAEERVS
jgi:uncharacterized protein (TIRG00374 family)